MLLSCSSPMIPGDSLTAKAEKAKRWGYDAIALFWPLDDWTPDVRQELLTLERRTGVRPVEFVLQDAVYGHAMSPDPDLRGRCRAMYIEAASVCAEIGAVTEIEYEYGARDPLPLFHPYQQLDGAQETEFIDFYRQALEVVEGSDGQVLLEPINRYECRYLNLTADNLRIIDAVGHPNAGLLPDTFHMSIEEADPADAIRQAGGQVRHVHLGDNNRLLPGHGRLDWESIFGALAEIGFDGAVNLECSTEGDPEQSLPPTAERLRELIAP
ncbi:sugar phosphate isomerase/epimerase [Nocardioides albertanoniae]|uniref:Sugar phosphate isomerase/epimerase n=1 Tax=Nocardioides albertanoniae TaxID=1175486 RepID=A0A543A4H9_9ACTN|nr:sugar phosphate isomerase/epimerase family protein [Nocardioides albertanoniae]TQL67376.1 sugar phosphate isomerase/epimerase [Nocardioides albertanoniae]